MNWTWVIIILAGYLAYWGYKEYRKRRRGSDDEDDSKQGD